MRDRQSSPERTGACGLGAHPRPARPFESHGDDARPVRAIGLLRLTSCNRGCLGNLDGFRPPWPSLCLDDPFCCAAPDALQEALGLEPLGLANWLRVVTKTDLG